MGTPRQLTEEATQQFQEGISLIFSRWFALQAAVENRWGGPHSHAKALDFASRVFEFFHQPNRRGLFFFFLLNFCSCLRLIDSCLDFRV